MGRIGICIVTHSRLDLLKKCLEAVVQTTGHLCREILVWDNASTDATRDYLIGMRAQTDIRVIFHDKNIGTNAKGLALEALTGDYLVGIDDDVVFLPSNWIERMLDAFQTEPRLGYLALDVVQDESTNGAKPPEDHYFNRDYGNGLVLQFGPVGGWCFMIPRQVYRRVGKLRYCRRTSFFAEDGDYVMRCKTKGFLAAILKGVRCYHATGLQHNMQYMDVYNHKMKQWKMNDFDLHKLITYFEYGIYKIKSRLVDEHTITDSDRNQSGAG